MQATTLLWVIRSGRGVFTWVAPESQPDRTL